MDAGARDRATGTASKVYVGGVSRRAAQANRRERRRLWPFVQRVSLVVGFIALAYIFLDACADAWIEHLAIRTDLANHLRGGR